MPLGSSPFARNRTLLRSRMDSVDKTAFSLFAVFRRPCRTSRCWRPDKTSPAFYLNESPRAAEVSRSRLYRLYRWVYRNLLEHGFVPQDYKPHQEKFSQATCLMKKNQLNRHNEVEIYLYTQHFLLNIVFL